MDKLDVQILSCLLNNCRTPDRQIGKELGVSGVAVKSRIQKMIEQEIIEEFSLRIQPPVLGFSVIYFIVTGKELQDIIDKISLVGEPLFIIPCVGGITVCSIIVKGEPTQKIEIAKSLLKDIRLLSIFEAKNPEIRSDLTRTDIEIIDILLKDPRLRIEEISKLSGFSTKTIARSLDKLQNDDAIQFTLIYNPQKMGIYIPFAILVYVDSDVKRTLKTLEKKFGDQFLQNPIVHQNRIVMFLFSNNIFKIDEITDKIGHIERIGAVDLFIPKGLTFPTKWIKNAIGQARKSKRLHLTPEIHS